MSEKAEILAAAAMPGARVAEVARHYGVVANQIYNWRRQAAVGALEASFGFARAVVAADADTAQNGSAGRMVIVLPDDVKVEIGRDVDMAALERVLGLLRRR